MCSLKHSVEFISAPCKPGTYSDTGFEPCILCEFGFYQAESQQKNCTLCPNGTSTRSKESNSLDNCEGNIYD